MALYGPSFYGMHIYIYIYIGGIFLLILEWGLSNLGNGRPKGCFGESIFFSRPLRLALNTSESLRIDGERVVVHFRALDGRFSAQRLLRSFSRPAYWGWGLSKLYTSCRGVLYRVSSRCFSLCPFFRACLRGQTKGDELRANGDFRRFLLSLQILAFS